MSRISKFWLTGKTLRDHVRQECINCTQFKNIHFITIFNYFANSISSMLFVTKQLMFYIKWPNFLFEPDMLLQDIETLCLSNTRIHRTVAFIHNNFRHVQKTAKSNY
jgi:hypothetical protein